MFRTSTIISMAKQSQLKCLNDNKEVILTLKLQNIWRNLLWFILSHLSPALDRHCFSVRQTNLLMEPSPWPCIQYFYTGKRKIPTPDYASLTIALLLILSSLTNWSPNYTIWGSVHKSVTERWCCSIEPSPYHIIPPVPITLLKSNK